MRQGRPDWKTYFKGVFILLLAPVLVLVALAIYVHLANRLPQSGPLQTSVSPQIVLPGREAAYYFTYLPEQSARNEAPPPPVDMVFLIDVSGSMTSSLPVMAKAAQQVASDLAVGNSDRIRFSLVRFDTEAEVLTDWTNSSDTLSAGLTRLATFTGGNDTRRAFEELKKLLNTTRTGAKKVIIFYTDGGLELCNGCPRQPMSEAEMIAESEKLRNDGADIYSIGPPAAEKSSLMIQMTGSPTHVLASVNLADLFPNFRSVAESALGGSLGAHLTHRIDGRHFSAPLEGTAWTRDASGALNLSLGSRPEVTSTYAHPLQPLSAGVWRVGIEPPRLTFTGEGGRLSNIAATRRPLVLVITWLSLLWLLLPLLLWTLIHFLRSRPEVVEHEVLLPEAIRPRPPSPLPMLAPRRPHSEPVIPTLFIGLGGAGRRALQATIAELKQTRISEDDQPYRFLWIDLDKSESERQTSFDSWDQHAIEPLLAPPEIYNTNSYLPGAQTTGHLRWFNAQSYLNAPRELLNLSEGSRGNRQLARLSLFQWVLGDSKLWSTLVAKVDELAALPTADGTSQIVVFASAEGGMGSGWFVDLGRILRRIVRARQTSSFTFVPQIIGVLCVSPEKPRPDNEMALRLEIESALLSGSFPQRSDYGPPEQEHLNAVDSETPYNWIFAANTGKDEELVAAQCGELSAILIERHPRNSLFDCADALGDRSVIAVRTRSVRVLPTEICERIHYDLWLRLFGPDILLDIEPAPGGGFATRAVSEQVINQQLADWSRREPGNPLQLLLAAASDANLASGYVRAMQSSSAPDCRWFTNALADSTSRSLHGHKNPARQQWERELTPGELVATLRLFADRLTSQVEPAVIQLGGTPGSICALQHCAKQAVAVADQLDDWIGQLSRFCEEVFSKRQNVGTVRSTLAGADRTYVDLPADQPSIDRLTKDILEEWLNTPDVSSTIRERLFFVARPHGDSISIRLRSLIGSEDEFITPAAARDKIDSLMWLLARGASTTRIGGSLAEESPEQRIELAERLIDTRAAPRRVLLVMPRPDDDRVGESRSLNDFETLIRQPANHGERLRQTGDDHSAIRRLELTAWQAKDSNSGHELPFIEPAEQVAERYRRRAEKKYGVSLPPFPPELRIALAHHEGFQSFIRAYRSGHILSKQDGMGRDQWTFSDTGEFLTFGAQRSLAKAAANYIYYVELPPQTFNVVGEGGDFSTLQRWLERRDYPDDETLAHLAIDVFED